MCGPATYKQRGEARAVENCGVYSPFNETQNLTF